MKVIFLGVGEAFDDNLPNNSHIISTGKTKLLLDCGYNIPQQLWRYNGDPNFLDAIYISHQHADHYFGLPAVLLRMWEGGRERDLTIICQRGLKDSFLEFMDVAYKGFIGKFEYRINLVEAEDGKTIEFQDLRISFQKTVHSGENLAVRISSGEKAIAYSGDGSPLSDSNFYQGLDLLILETYLYDKEIIGHSSIVSAVAFAEKNSAKRLALTHLNRDLRRTELPNIKEKIKESKVEVFVPEPLQETEI